MKHVIVVGTSEPQDFALIDQGAPIPGTGIVPTLEIQRYVDGALEAVDPAPVVAWLDEAAGTVRVTGTETLTVGNYLVRFKLTAGPAIGYAPNGNRADVWKVVAIPGV